MNLLKLKNEELEKINGLDYRGMIKAKSFKMMTSNIDEIAGMNEVHKTELENNIIKEICYKNGFRDVNAYVLGEERWNITVPSPLVQTEHDVKCYTILPGAYCDIDHNL